jgi:hypothetical protein
MAEPISTASKRVTRRPRSRRRWLPRRPSVIFRKVTGCFRSHWGARLYAATASIIATGGINGMSALQAIQEVIGRCPVPATPQLGREQLLILGVIYLIAGMVSVVMLSAELVVSALGQLYFKTSRDKRKRS